MVPSGWESLPQMNLAQWQALKQSGEAADYLERSLI